MNVPKNLAAQYELLELPPLQGIGVARITPEGPKPIKGFITRNGSSYMACAVVNVPCKTMADAIVMLEQLPQVVKAKKVRGNPTRPSL